MGSTAACVLIVGNRLYAANVGDSRAILCSEGKAIELTWDHNLSRTDEKLRIQAAGGLDVGKVCLYILKCLTFQYVGPRTFASDESVW